MLHQALCLQRAIFVGQIGINFHKYFLKKVQLNVDFFVYMFGEKIGIWGIILC
jgi:hypothetical protein